MLLKIDPDCTQDTLFSQTFTSQSLLPTSTWKMQDPWMRLSHRVGKQCSLPDLMQRLLCGSTSALTLSNGQDQVPFFMEAPVELWRPEEAVPEGGKPSPSNCWLDSFLGRKLQVMGSMLGPPAFMNLSLG